MSPRSGAPTSASSVRKLRVDGDTVAASVKRLKTLHWYKTLSGALSAGRKQNKPVLWIQALGKLTGFT